MTGEKTKSEGRLSILNTQKKTKTSILKTPELEERYQDIIVTIKKAAAKKEIEAHDTRNNAKDQMERKNAAAAAEAESTLVDTVAHETEGSTTKRSSKAGNLRGGLAHLEHRRPVGWTSPPCGSDDEKKCSERDKTRPHPLVRTGGEEDAHEIITNTGCSSGCDLRAGERLPTQRPLGEVQKNILVHK